MKFFTCLLDPQGRGLSDTVRQRYESPGSSRGIPFRWHCFDQVLVLTGSDEPGGDPLVVHVGHHVAVGTVRLDNRADLERWSGLDGEELCDLTLVLHTVARHGTRHIPDILGDFAFLVWNAATRTAVLACDPFGVKKLYYSESNGRFAFASRGEALALEARYDVQFLAERVAACAPSRGLSVYAGVKSVPAATVAVLEHGKLIMRQYWSVQNFMPEPNAAMSEYEASEVCRSLLAESVRLRVRDRADAWAQLSGGIDSSSVVSVAQWLYRSGVVGHGLAGTVTFVDSHGTGADEREYSDAVIDRWRVGNETIIDPPLWQDDEFAPPYTDEPNAFLPVHPRDHRLCGIVRGSGGRVLLTGVGGDELFTGNMFFFADWLVRGRVWPALREMARRAAIGRVSFWELAYRNALLPLLPRPLQVRLVRDDGQMPPWVAQANVRRYELHLRAAAPLSYAGRIGHKYHDAVAMGPKGFASGLSLGLIDDTLDVRHPFLYRPLVEFALQLPPEFCTRPHARKWILRQAMRGILPEVVRNRIGKGVTVGRAAWSMTTQRHLLEPLVKDPILAELGIIDGSKLRAVFAALQCERANREKLSAVLQYTLAIEAWLQMRSGRWPCRGNVHTAV
jgi:asparagine synthase (glutamine-hydrolysing)